MSTSREGRTYQRLRLLRWLVLLALCGTVAGVGGLYWFGRSNQDPRRPEASGNPEANPSRGDDAVTRGQGFERTFTEGERPVFSIKGDSYSIDRNNVVLLKKVELSLYREDGTRFDVAGDDAQFFEEEKEARLSGNVRLAGPSGLVMHSDDLTLGQGGRHLSTVGAVSFAIGDGYLGNAGRLDARLPSRIFQFDGPVHVESTPSAQIPLTLDAERVFLERDRQLVRAEGAVKLTHGRDLVEAERLAIFLSEDERSLRFLRARWDVRARLSAGSDLPAVLGQGGGVESTTELTAGDVAVLFSEKGTGPERVEMAGAATPAVLISRAPGGGRKLTAPRIVTTLRGGAPVALEAGTGAVLEGLGEDARLEGLPVRRARGDELRADFGPAGEIVRVTLDGAVEVDGPDLSASGQRGIFDASAGTAEFEGTPARAANRRGQVEAPRIRYTRATGSVQGNGGVRARLTESDASVFASSPLARGDGPIWVEAVDGEMRESPRSFTFKERVRAWRGENLLVADELVGQEAQGKLTATGRVRSQFSPEPKAGSEASGGVIDARGATMVYERNARRLVYRGEVVAAQDGRTLACDEMTVALAPAGGVESLLCTGNARVEDPAAGRTLRGERALYRPGARTIEVDGGATGKVTLRDAGGNVVEGPRMLYEIATNRVRMLSRNEGTP